MAISRASLAGKARSRPDLVRTTLDKARRDGIVATFPRAGPGRRLSLASRRRRGDRGRQRLEAVFRIGPCPRAGAGFANHAELNVIPRNLAVPIPERVEDEDACFATLGLDRDAPVRNLVVRARRCRRGARSSRLPGSRATLLAVQGARVARSITPGTIGLAARTGAECSPGTSASPAAVQPAPAHRRIGCDAVLIAAASELERSAGYERPRSLATAQALRVGKPDGVPYAAFMKKEISLVVSALPTGPGLYDDRGGGVLQGSGVKDPGRLRRWTRPRNLRESSAYSGPHRRLDVKSLIPTAFT